MDVAMSKPLLSPLPIPRSAKVSESSWPWAHEDSEDQAAHSGEEAGRFKACDLIRPQMATPMDSSSGKGHGDACQARSDRKQHQGQAAQMDDVRGMFGGEVQSFSAEQP